ncbi:MAG: hypothetical protein ACTTIZ_09240 [Treponema sp.]
MKVLHSTDVIGEEIKEEARKKADRILKNADLEVETLKKALIEKLEKLEQEQREIYSNKIQKYRDSVFVTLPLKKWKKKLEYVESVLNEALQTYFNSLTMDEKLEILKIMLNKFKTIVDGKTIKVKYAGFDETMVRKLVIEVFTNVEIRECREALYSEKRFSGVYEGIIIEDIDKNFICKAGMEQAKNNVFAEQKEKLAQALFGESLS